MAQVQHMEPEGKQSFAMATSLVVKMRTNMADAPYTFEKGAVTNWRFSLAYAQLSAFMPLAHQYLAASRLPYSEREEALQVWTTFSCFISTALAPARLAWNICNCWDAPMFHQWPHAAQAPVRERRPNSMPCPVPVPQ